MSSMNSFPVPLSSSAHLHGTCSSSSFSLPCLILTLTLALTLDRERSWRRGWHRHPKGHLPRRSVRSPCLSPLDNLSKGSPSKSMRCARPTTTRRPPAKPQSSTYSVSWITIDKASQPASEKAQLQKAQARSSGSKLSGYEYRPKNAEENYSSAMEARMEAMRIAEKEAKAARKAKKNCEHGQRPESCPQCGPRQFQVTERCQEAGSLP